MGGATLWRRIKFKCDKISIINFMYPRLISFNSSSIDSNKKLWSILIGFTAYEMLQFSYISVEHRLFKIWFKINPKITFFFDFKTRIIYLYPGVLRLAQGVHRTRQLLRWFHRRFHHLGIETVEPSIWQSKDCKNFLLI